MFPKPLITNATTSCQSRHIGRRAPKICILDDHSPISSTISDTSALLNLLTRPPECEQFLLNPRSLHGEESGRHLWLSLDLDLRDVLEIVRADKECVLARVKREPLDRKNDTRNLRNSKDVVLAAVESNGEG